MTDVGHKVELSFKNNNALPVKSWDIPSHAFFLSTLFTLPIDTEDIKYMNKIYVLIQ